VEELPSHFPHTDHSLITRQWAPVKMKRFMTPPSLQVLIVKRLIRDVDKEEVPKEQDSGQKAARVTGWFSGWKSEEMRWLPADLRSWLLEQGTELGPPGLLRRTYNLYVEPIEKKLLEFEGDASPKEIIRQEKKRKGKERVTNDNTKKQKQSTQDMGERNKKKIKEKNMKEVLGREAQDYSQLLERMKSFLSGSGRSVNFLKKLPVELRKDGSVVNQLTEYWLPTLIQYFGTLERFTYYFWKTEGGKEAITALMSSDDPAIEQLLNNNIDAFVKPKIREWRDKCRRCTILIRSKFSKVCSDRRVPINRNENYCYSKKKSESRTWVTKETYLFKVASIFEGRG
jgi:hypothetical protein